jgi:hypothetical protein
MNREKYGCFKVSNVEDRCFKLAPDSTYDPSFPTKTECIKNCNTPEEEEVLAKLKEKFKLKDLLQKLRPGILVAFDSIKDIPLLNYKGSPYNKKIFNNDELRHFYNIINTRKDNNKHPNKFLDDLVKKFNCTYGKNNHFIYNDEHILIKKLISQEEEEAELLDEILKFKSSSYKYMIKDILTSNIDSTFGHISLLLIKKENIDGKDLLSFFIFDPSGGSLVWLYNQIESLINKICSSKSINHRVIQLSKFFGIQSHEVNKPVSDDYSDAIEKIITNVKKNVNIDISIFNQLFIFDIATEIAKKYITLSHLDLPVGDQSMGELIFPKNFTNYDYIYPPEQKFSNLKELIKSNSVLLGIFSPKKGWIKQNIDHGFIKLEDLKGMEEMLFKIGKSKFRNLFKDHLFEEDIDIHIKKYINDIFTNNFNEPFIPLSDILDKKLLTLSAKQFEIATKMEELTAKVNIFYDFDYFSGYCYMWCYYIIILILMNDSFDPYLIIKATFFQTKDEKIMKKIIDNYLHKNLSEDDMKGTLFHKDYVTYMNKYIEDAKKNMSTLYDPTTIELRRTLFFKITNLQTLNIIYNKTFDKYINYSIIPPAKKYISITKFIPQKADDLLKEFTLPGVDPSLGLDELREAIINTVIAGELLPKVNEKISTTLPKGTLTYEEKYLKYKKKYLLLKKQINI